MCNKSELFNISGILVTILSVISLISSLIIISLYFIYKDIRGISMQILMCISITDLFRCIFLIFPSDWYEQENLCQISAIVVESSLTSNAVWSIYIMFILKQLYSYHPDKPKLYFKTWLVIGFVLAQIFQVLPMITDSYGPNQGICTYKNDDVGVIWRTIQQSLVMACITGCLVLYYRIFIKLRRLKILTWKEMVFEKGMSYSIIFFIILFLINIHRFSENYLNYCENYTFSLVSYTALSLHGFLDFSAMFLNKNFRPFILAFFQCKKLEPSISINYLDLLENKV